MKTPSKKYLLPIGDDQIKDFVREAKEADKKGRVVKVRIVSKIKSFIEISFGEEVKR